MRSAACPCRRRPSRSCRGCAGQVVADEAVDAEDEDFHGTSVRSPRRSPGAMPAASAREQAGSSGCPSSCKVMRRTAPSPAATVMPSRSTAVTVPGAAVRMIVACGRRPPDQELRAAQSREGAGIGVGDAAHQIIDPAGGPAPVDAAVGRLAPAAIGTFRQIHGDRPRRARRQRRQRAVEQPPGRRLQLAVESERGVGRLDRHPLLIDEIAGVRLRHHVMEAHPGLALPLDQHPVDRRPAAVARQQRAVEVERAARSDLQHLGGDHVPVIEREQEIRRVRGDQLAERRALGIFRIVHRYPARLGAGGQRVPPDLLARIVAMGEHGGHLEAVAQQRLETEAPHGVIAEDDRSQELVPPRIT